MGVSELASAFNSWKFTFLCFFGFSVTIGFPKAPWMTMPPSSSSSSLGLFFDWTVSCFSFFLVDSFGFSVPFLTGAGSVVEATAFSFAFSSLRFSAFHASCSASNSAFAVSSSVTRPCSLARATSSSRRRRLLCLAASTSRLSRLSRDVS